MVLVLKIFCIIFLFSTTSSSIIPLDIKKELLAKFHENYIKSKNAPGNYYKLMNNVYANGDFYEEIIQSAQDVNKFSNKFKLYNDKREKINQCLKSGNCDNIQQLFNSPWISSLRKKSNSIEESVRNSFNFCFTKIPGEKTWTYTAYKSMVNFQVNCQNKIAANSHDLSVAKLNYVYISQIKKDNKVYIIAISGEVGGQINKQYGNYMFIEYQRGIYNDEIERMVEIIESKAYLSSRSIYFEELGKLEKEINPDKKGSEEGKIKQAFIERLKNMVDNSRQISNEYDKKIRNIYSIASVYMDTFIKNEMENVFAKYNFPQKLLDQIQEIMFHKSASYTGKINLIESKGIKGVEEYIGYVDKNNDKIFFALIKTITQGELPGKCNFGLPKEQFYRILDWVTQRQKVEWFFSECRLPIERKINELSKVELTDEQKKEIKNILLAISTGAIKKKLKVLNTAQTLLGSNGQIYSQSKKYKAIISEKGQIIVGDYDNPNVDTIDIIGRNQDINNGPYSLQVDDEGRFFIINKDDDKVWTSDYYFHGVPPFSLKLENNGALAVYDYEGKQIYRSKN